MDANRRPGKRQGPGKRGDGATPGLMMAILASRFRWFLPLLVLVLSSCDSGSSPSDSADLPSADAGRRMYLEGIRPSGEPMTAIVAGDVPVLGTQFSCESCHGRKASTSCRRSRDSFCLRHPRNRQDPLTRRRALLDSFVTAKLPAAETWANSCRYMKCRMMKSQR